jgi:flavin-binding protein dodecin
MRESTAEEARMAGNTYKIIELVGTSAEGVTDAIDSAVARASQTLKGLDWFEVRQIRGPIENGRVAWYQVDMRIGFKVMSPEELQAEV